MLMCCPTTSISFTLPLFCVRHIVPLFLHPFSRTFLFLTLQCLFFQPHKLLSCSHFPWNSVCRLTIIFHTTDINNLVTSLCLFIYHEEDLWLVHYQALTEAPLEAPTSRVHILESVLSAIAAAGWGEMHCGIPPSHVWCTLDRIGGASTHLGTRSILGTPCLLRTGTVVKQRSTHTGGVPLWIVSFVQLRVVQLPDLIWGCL